MKQVSVVIPTFNGRHLLEKNLGAVCSCLRSGDEIVVVDDASSDDTQQWFSTFSPPKKISLRYHLNTHNLRFGAAVNKGVSLAKNELVFVLNNDVAPHSDILQYLLPHFDQTTTFAVGCLEIESDAQQRGGKNQLWFERGIFQHSRATNFEAGSTAWVSGGSGMFSRKKWLQLGGFDDRYYPAYWEDIDLSWQARKRGWSVLFEPRAVVDHNHETTNSQVFGDHGLNQMSWRNAHRFVWKNGTLTQKLANLFWRPYWWYARHMEQQ